MNSAFPVKQHRVDFCVVGGGLAGLCAAVAAARHGARVALMHDRPVLGGNASSEVRMWICGAKGEHLRETGIVEEIMLENLYRNPAQNYSIWDSILYEKVRFEPNIELLLNCSCMDAEMRAGGIHSVTGWQLTTQTTHVVEATLFADCSGDSILAPLTGADFRCGREAAGEFNEDIAPPDADRRTMGMSCLIQSRETDRAQPFIPPTWAHVYETDDQLPHREHVVKGNNFWWLELGGMNDSIHDTEVLRDELLKRAFGIWDHIKNRGDHGADNWALEWVGFLPGKRESRRYLGAHVLTQNDVRAEGRFDDGVAYGGWPMDDHHPGGLDWEGVPTIFHPAPSPFGIPFRCLYSRNVPNLMFAGRNISATHAALSATRVMATCGILGQAVGTAAAAAVCRHVPPAELCTPDRMRDVQQTLMDDDCYLPWQGRAVSGLTRAAQVSASVGDAETLRTGVDRPVGEAGNGWIGRAGDDWVQYAFPEPVQLHAMRFIFDSDLNRDGPSGCHRNIVCCFPLDAKPRHLPPSLVRAFRVESCDGDGAWTTIARVDGNYQRHVKIDIAIATRKVRFVIDATWGDPEARIFAWDVL